MNYLDQPRLGALSSQAFRDQQPYPWLNPEGLLTDDAFLRLTDSLPQLSQFDSQFKRTRKFSQQSHDRFALSHGPDLELSPAWRTFIAELQGDHYREFVSRLFGTKRFRLRFQWHYTPRGCSVSPHCDSHGKLGSHIFYFNPAGEWKRSWGGETLILDARGRFSRRSNPSFEEFDTRIATDPIGNRSLIFQRLGNTWHGMESLRCPEDRMRRVFIVVIEQGRRLERLLSGWRF